MLQCVAPSGLVPKVDDPLDRLRRDGPAPARPGGIVDDPLQFDEFGPLSIKPQQGWCWAPRGKTRRLRSDYNRRHGVRCLLGAHDVGADYLWGEMTASKDAERVLAFLRAIRARYPARIRIYPRHGQPLHPLDQGHPLLGPAEPRHARAHPHLRELRALTRPNGHARPGQAHMRVAAASPLGLALIRSSTPDQLSSDREGPQGGDTGSHPVALIPDAEEGSPDRPPVGCVPQVAGTNGTSSISPIVRAALSTGPSRYRCGTTAGHM